MNFKCGECGAFISEHNKVLHDGLCDTCFYRKYFPEDQAAYERRVIVKDGRTVDPVGLTSREFEKELGLTDYIETKEGVEDRLYTEALLEFLERHSARGLAVYSLYEEEIINSLDFSQKEIMASLELLCQGKGDFFSDEPEVSYALTDKSTFFLIVLQGILFFSGTQTSTKAISDILSRKRIKFFYETID